MKKWHKLIIIITIWIAGTTGGWKLIPYLSKENAGSIVAMISILSLIVPCVLLRMRDQNKINRQWQERIERLNLKEISFHTKEKVIIPRCYSDRVGYKKYFLPIDDMPKEITIKSEEREFTYLLKEDNGEK